MTMSWSRSHPALVGMGGLVLGVGAGMMYYHRQSIAQAVQSSRLLQSTVGLHRRIVIVSDVNEWENVASQLAREAKCTGAIGFDCEWVQVKGNRRPVALLQLATNSGLCVLLRLVYIKTNIPRTLMDLLEDSTVLKVGVGVTEDSKYLAQDYGIQVKGCVDLRHLVVRHLNSSSGTEVEKLDLKENEGVVLSAEDKKWSTISAQGLGLNSLAETYLGRTLDKDWRVRASNWEADTLTQRQINYAAEDAIVGIQILMALMEKLWKTESVFVAFSPWWVWQKQVARAVHHTCAGLIDVRFTANKQNNHTEVKKKSILPPNKWKTSLETSVGRKSQHYYNCELRAPDDLLLSIIDPKKAWWYVEKGLGDLISEEPLVVRLKFEPAGRPQAEKEDGKFYLESRQNVCVVCGTKDTYNRKNVVPHEYRKYFPALLKLNSTHDVVLLCSKCHCMSNIEDSALRNQLAEECDAPICAQKKVSNEKAIRAAGALLKNRSNLPEKRILGLQKLVKEYLKVDEVTLAQINEVANMKVEKYHKGSNAHGYKVNEVYKKIGLIKLEQRWRQHFLTTMNPQYLPSSWSVNHNIYKMKLKMGRLPLDHPDRTIYKMALVGTEGEIDIPYTPRQNRDDKVNISTKMREAIPPRTSDKESEESSLSESPDDLEVKASGNKMN